MSTDSVLFLGIFCAQKEEPEKDKDEMACRREEGSEARLLAVVHVDARRLRVVVRRMTVEYGRGLRLKSAPSSLLTHSTIINSFSFFYFRIPPTLCPSFLPSFLPYTCVFLLCYLSHEISQELQNPTSQLWMYYAKYLSTNAD